MSQQAETQNVTAGAWPKLSQINNSTITPAQLTLQTRDICMEVTRFAIDNPKRKVPSAYVASLSQITLDLIKKMSGLPTLQSIEERLAHLQRLNEVVKEDTTHSRAMIQGIRERPDPSRGSTAGLELRQLERRVCDAISDCTSSFKPQPHTSITSITEASSSDLSSNVSNLRIRVRVIDRDVVQSLRRATALETRSRIDETVTTYADIQNAQAQAFTQLPSGDVELRLGTMDDAGKLTRHEEIWAKLFGAGAHVLHDTFSVVLHGIRTSTIEAHQTNWATISRLLLAKNAPLFPNADILHTGWLCSAKAKQKSKTSIVVLFSSPEDGNRAIEQGMIWEGSAHSAELYSPGCQMQQCHKCQHYGHLGSRCHAPIKCAICAGDHQSRSCLVRKNGGEYKCALCNGAHTLYDPVCPQRQKQFDAVLKARKERPFPLFHPTPTKPNCRILSNFSSPSPLPNSGGRVEAEAASEKPSPGRWPDYDSFA